MKKISNVILWIILLIILCFVFFMYKENNFNDFIRSEAKLHTSQFKRDKKIKYSEMDSYKIVSDTLNDASFFKTINVKKNTPYKISCMVKTENILPEKDMSGIGAQISIIGTTERSIAILGTKDWQRLEFVFNSKNREQIDIGFRLGGYLGNCTGTAWFSDFTIKEGIASDSNNWNFACFIFENTDVILNNKEIKISMDENDIYNIKDIIYRFKNTCRDLSKNKMTANYDIYQIKTPIDKLTYDEQFGYFVAPEDIEESIKDIVAKKDYDHIFVIVRLGNEKYENDIQINDWIGLGSMDYYGIGYSNIRLPNSSQSYIYKYNTRINTFPEEVLLHEFLHSLERTAEEYGYEIPALHDNEKYGYKNQNLIGLKKWYEDYMNKNINSSVGNIGLPQEIYTLKPAKILDFEYSYKIDEFHEPQNIIEEIRQFFKNVINNISNIGQVFKNNTNQNLEFTN